MKSFQVQILNSHVFTILDFLYLQEIATQFACQMWYDVII